MASRQLRTSRRTQYSRTAILGVLTALAACQSEPDDTVVRAPALVADGATIDSLFPSSITFPLAEDSLHLFGAFGGASGVTSNGEIVLADEIMKEVRMYSSDGASVAALGKVGAGPGEYRGPSGIAISPFSDAIGIVDGPSRKVLIYPGGSSEATMTRVVRVPGLAGMTMLFGPGDSILLLGSGVVGPTAASVFDGAVLRIPQDPDSEVPAPRMLLPRRREHSRPFAHLFVRGHGTQTRDFAYLAHNLSQVLYRVRFNGDVIDSIQIPNAVYSSPQVPDSLPAGRSAITDAFRALPRFDRVVAVNDSIFILEFRIYSAARAEWRGRLALLRWTSDPTIMVTDSCDCRILGAAGDSIATFTGGAERGYWASWRRLPQ